MDEDSSAAFAVFFEEAEPRLRMALAGAFGPDLGREAAADALAWAWQHWSRLDDMDNPIGYLYRVGRSRGLRHLGRREFATADGAFDRSSEDPDPDVTLLAHVAQLPERQRVAVWMVHGLGYPHAEVAEVLGCSRPTVATHVRRGLRRLRQRLEAESRV